MRKLLFRLHLLAGLSIGLYLVVASLTGLILIFETEAEVLLTSQQMQVEPTTSRLSLPEVVAIAESAGSSLSEGRNVIKRISYPRRPEDTFMVTVERGEEHFQVFLHPATGKVLGERPEGDGIIPFVLRLHTALLAGETGRTLGALAALLGVFVLISGFFLWWPVRGKTGLWPRQGANLTRRLYDWHNLLGVFSGPVVALCALTGAVIFWWEPVGRFLERFPFAQRHEIPPPAFAKWHGPGAVPLKELETRSALAAPQTILTRVWLKGQGVQFERVPLAFAEGKRWEKRVLMRFDKSGALTSFSDARQEGWNRKLLNWTGVLHFGTWGGWPTRVLYAVAMLAPLGLFITGAGKWWRRWRGSLQNRLRHRTPPIQPTQRQAETSRSSSLPDPLTKQPAKNP